MTSFYRIIQRIIKHPLYLPVSIVFAVLLAVMSGFLFGEQMIAVEWIGDLFLNALKMLVIPLIMSSMINGITRMGDIRKLGRTGLITILYYTVTTGLAVFTGLLLSNVLPFDHAKVLPGMEEGIHRSVESFSPVDVIRGMIPENIVHAMANMDILPVIVFSLFFGITLSTMNDEPDPANPGVLRNKKQPLIDFFESLEAVMMRMIHVIVIFSPLGIFGLVAGKLASAGGGDALLEQIWNLRWYVRNIIVGLSIHMFVTLPILLFVFTGRNPFRYITGMATALLTAFSTASSSATIPVTMDCAETNNKVSDRATGFVIPLGATINMDGTALYEAVAVMFIASLYGIELSFMEQVIVLFTATLAAIGAAGIPEAGLVTMVLVLKSVNLPAEGIGLILAIDWFLDRLRTSVNVWGDAVGAAVVDSHSNPAGHHSAQSG